MNIQKIFEGSLFLVLTLFMNGCTDDYSIDIAPGPGVTPQVTFTPENGITFTGDGGSSTIEVISNMPDSTISTAVDYSTASESWCIAKINSNKVTITAEKNTSYSPRTATLKIKAFNQFFRSFSLTLTKRQYLQLLIKAFQVSQSDNHSHWVGSLA